MSEDGEEGPEDGHDGGDLRNDDGRAGGREGDDGGDGGHVDGLDDGGDEDDGWSPVLAIAFGPMVGTLGGIVVGIVFLVDVGRAITVGIIAGTLLGTMVYALLQAGSEG
jgi:hypothetical protein